MSKYDAWSTAVSLALRNKGQLRKGQIYMNCLHTIDPDLYKEITGSDADCFYFDGKIDKFLEKLNASWLT